jgi:protein-tyrosine-phosphatase
VRSSDRQADLGSHAIRASFICTANRARSPFAAALLRRERTPFPLVVDSFGTLDREGAPALPQAIRAAREFDIDLGDHRARAATTGRLELSDLVIGFEHFHVAHAVVTGGAPRSRVFLLAELARALVDLAPPPPGDDVAFRDAVGRADAARSASDWRAPAIPDPVGGSDRRFVETYEEIERMVATVAVRLFGGDERTVRR